MIPAQSSISQVDTLPGQEIAFTIGDPRWVMQSLSDLYSNKELAVTREYSTNARDAMVEAGKADQPIEVTLPSSWHPYFKVRDYGPGMSEEVLTKVYTSFGDSTKRDSNAFNGMLGFGCKSAVAYTDNFTVTSIHRGIKNVAVITRKSDFSIVMKIVSSQPTDEASGTEVVVPVHNWQEFAHKANDFYKFWQNGTVMVNGEFPVQAVGEKLTDSLYYADSNQRGLWGESHVVMGNVPYRINNPQALFRDTRMNPINFVAYVPNGSVEFTPSREDLKYTDLTRSTLQQVISDFESKIVETAKAEIDAASNHFEAYVKWAEWTSRLGRALFADLDFNGDKFVDTFSVRGVRYQPYAHSYGTHRISQWNVSALHNTIFITDYKGMTVPSSDKAKARDWLAHKGMRTTYFIFTEDKIDSPWVDQTTERFVKWDDLKAELPKKPRKPRAKSTAPGRIPGTFDYWTKGGKHFEKEIPSGVTVYYVRAKEVKPKYDEVLAPAQVLNIMNDDGVVVLLAANRIEKFVRENPKAIDFLPHFRGKVVKDAKTLLSNDAKEMLALGGRTIEWLSRLDPNKLDDPEFKRAAELVEREHELMEDYNRNMNLAYALHMRYNVDSHTIRGTNERLVSKYPLLDAVRYGYYGGNNDHIYIYMNAAYAAEKKGN